MSTILLRLFALCVLGLLGCAEVQSGETTPEQAKSDTELADENACALFSARLCSDVGTDSEACEMVRRVSQWLAPHTCQVALNDVDTTLAKMKELRADCDEVGEKLCAKVPDRDELCARLKGDLQKISPDQCSRLKEEYPKVEEAFMQRLEAEAPLDEAAQQQLLAGDPPQFGPEDAKVVVGVFSDFECPYCAMAATTLEQIRKDFGEQVLLVFHHLPLPFHEQALPAAKAAVAAHKQGKFWEYHDLLFADQEDLSKEKLESHAKNLGLSMKKFRKDRDSDATAQAIADDMKLAETLHVRGTPTMFVNGQRVENPMDYPSLEKGIQLLLNGARMEEAASESSEAEDGDTVEDE